MTQKPPVNLLIISGLIIILAWLLDLFVYAILLAAPLAYMYFRAPDWGWKKPIILGLLLCSGWYMTNIIAILSLVPIGELGFSRALREAMLDLISFREIPGEALAYPLYRSRLFLSFLGVTAFTYAVIQSPVGRGLGWHKALALPSDYKYSERTTAGSARWADEKELRLYLKKTGPGSVIGKNLNNQLYILPYENDFKYQRNQNIVVFGATGSGKTMSFVKPNILQADTSFVITDPKQELYNEMAPFLRNEGYSVYKLNLVNMDDPTTNTWNPLVKKDGSCDLSIQDAAMIASGIIKNTRDGPDTKKGDPFWDDSQMALFTALILYASKHFNPDHSKPEGRFNKTFSDILKFATRSQPAALDYAFSQAKEKNPSDPAVAAYAVYKQAGENVRASIMISFGVKMQLFNDDKLARLTSKSDFDLDELGKKKTAIFVNISDYDTTYNMISAMFFIHAFQELYKTASQHNGTLPVPVRFTMDEFCNIGYIPDYTVKLSTMRSRGISSQMIVQSLEQLKNRYPFGLAEEIIGNSDTRVLMGANDIETAEYFTDMIGNATVLQETHTRSDKELIDAGNISQKETKRPLISPDEIMRLPNEELIALIRGTHPARIRKVSYTEHPNAPALRKLSGDPVPPEAPPTGKAPVPQSETAGFLSRLNTSNTEQPADTDLPDPPVSPDDDFRP